MGAIKTIENREDVKALVSNALAAKADAFETMDPKVLRKLREIGVRTSVLTQELKGDLLRFSEYKTGSYTNGKGEWHLLVYQNLTKGGSLALFLPEWIKAFRSGDVPFNQVSPKTGIPEFALIGECTARRAQTAAKEIMTDASAFVKKTRDGLDKLYRNATQSGLAADWSIFQRELKAARLDTKSYSKEYVKNGEINEAALIDAGAVKLQFQFSVREEEL